MKKPFPKRGKNRDLLVNFGQYCANHPEERFWQALRNWSEVGFVLVSKNNTIHYSQELIDTFYFEGKCK